MEPFTEAMQIVAEVMRHGATSHPDNDWFKAPARISPNPRQRASTALEGRRSAAGPRIARGDQALDGTNPQGDWLMETKGTETCPDCNNRGPFTAVMCGPKHPGGEELGCRMTTLACEFCGGLGIVEVEVANRYRRGEKLRRLRVTSGISRSGSKPTFWASARCCSTISSMGGRNGRPG